MNQRSTIPKSLSYSSSSFSSSSSSTSVPSTNPGTVFLPIEITKTQNSNNPDINKNNQFRNNNNQDYNKKFRIPSIDDIQNDCHYVEKEIHRQIPVVFQDESYKLSKPSQLIVSLLQVNDVS